MTRTIFAVTAVLALVLGVSTYAQHDMHGSQKTDAEAHAKMMNKIDHAVAVMIPTDGNKTHGTVQFVQHGDSVSVTADISGLEPNAKHAIHVHEFGDLTASDGTGCGGHYNPEGHDHGLPEQDMRHAGDLGNLTADADGNAHYQITADNFTIAGMHNPVLGRGVIIHAKVDDGGQPTGNAGARIAMGVIGVAKNP